MKKLLILLFVTICLITACCSGRLYMVHSTDEGALQIAIFIPTTHLALQEIEQGFKETLLQGSKPCHFTTFNANGNRTLLRAQAEELVQGGYDLIFTIGANCSQTIAELLNKKNVKIPHVFSGVDGPAFAESLASLNSSSTGVYVKIDYQKQMESLHQYKPNIKNMLLVYDPTHGTGLENDKREIEEYVKKFDIRLHTVEVYQTNEIQQKVAASLSNIDVVLVLIDNTVVAGIDALVALCNRYGVTLFASDLASGKKGAALAYGITEYESGTGAGASARAILEQGKQPHELAIMPVVNARMEINQETMKAQNLTVDDMQKEDHA